MIGTYIRVKCGNRKHLTGYVLKQGSKYITVSIYNKGKWGRPRLILPIEIAEGTPVRVNPYPGDKNGIAD